MSGRTRIDGAHSSVAQAQDRVDEWTRTARTARLAAAPALRARARWRTRVLHWAVVAAAVVAVVLAVTAAILGFGVRSAHTRDSTRSEVIDAADAAVTGMLSADPADPQGYVDRILAVSTGALHDRLFAARAALMAQVGAQPGPSVGQVISSGLVNDPADDPDAGDTADVLTVADATNPALLGATPQAPVERARHQDLTAERITVALTMERTGGGWRVAQARAL